MVEERIYYLPSLWLCMRLTSRISQLSTTKSRHNNSPPPLSHFSCLCFSTTDPPAKQISKRLLLEKAWSHWTRSPTRKYPENHSHFFSYLFQHTSKPSFPKKFSKKIRKTNNHHPNSETTPKSLESSTITGVSMLLCTIVLPLVPPMELISFKNTYIFYYCYFTIEAKLENWYKKQENKKKLCFEGTSPPSYTL